MTDGAVTYRGMKPGEAEETFAVLRRGFDAFVRDDFRPEGVAEFYRAARDRVFHDPPDHVILVAESDGRIVGMIDVKESNHISLFFVEPARMGRGIGRGLLAHAVALCRREDPGLREIDVNSSPWAVPVYARLGFRPTGPEQEQNGIRYTRMVKNP